MPRPHRVELPGGIFHVTARGAGQQDIYRDDTDRKGFIGCLRQVVRVNNWGCLTYCLMGNHYHLVIELREANLSAGMQRLNGEYARMFNDRHRRSGHLFQGRFWSKLVRRDSQMLELARYVALNPVHANLTASPDGWSWSAHRALVAQAPSDFVDVAGMLRYFDENLELGRQRYAAFVRDCE
jgi:putative transposase